MTQQEVFDKVARHLLTQNKPCEGNYNGRTICLYRNDEGLKCAAGCLIPDEFYSEVFEGKRFGAVHDLMYELGFTPFSSEVLYLISTLQNLHDECSSVVWRQRLLRIAETFELSKEALQEFEVGI